MARVLVFDARFTDESGVGQTVDTDIRVEFYESGATTPKETRILGPQADSAIYETADSLGTLYTTTLDVSTYALGDVTARWYATLNSARVEPYPFVETLLNAEIDDRLATDEIIRYARTMLGFPAVAVELTSEHYRVAIEETLSIYNRWVPETRYTFVELELWKNAYELPHLPTAGPYDVDFVRKEGIPLISDPLFGREYPRGQQLDFDQYVLGIAFWETLRRVTSQEPEWVWAPDTKTLYINIGGSLISGSAGNYFVCIRYFVPSTISRVREDCMHWFKRYVLVQCKKMLLRIRGKYSGMVPAPGGAMRLDSDQLAREIETEEKTLMAEVRNFMPPVPPIFG